MNCAANDQSWVRIPAAIFLAGVSDQLDLNYWAPPKPDCCQAIASISACGKRLPDTNCTQFTNPILDTFFPNRKGIQRERLFDFTLPESVSEGATDKLADQIFHDAGCWTPSSAKTKIRTGRLRNQWSKSRCRHPLVVKLDSHCWVDLERSG